MPKKLHQHTVHWSDEIEALAQANRKKVGAKSLNSYLEMLIEHHDELLRACQTSAQIAEKWRALLRTLREK